MINILNKNKIYTTQNAFTLAEVLITLGIIGIVAAMTLPAVISKYQESVTIAKLKKAYSVLSQAMLFTVEKDGDYSSLPVEDWNTAAMKEWFDTALKPHIKTVSICYDTPGCWADGTKTLNGQAPIHEAVNGLGSNIIVFSTPDGYTVNLDTYHRSDIENLFGVNTDQALLVAYVDINGRGNPNVIGKDIFILVFTEKGFVPAGNDRSKDEVNTNCSLGGNGYFCLKKIINDGWKIGKVKG